MKAKFKISLYILYFFALVFIGDRLISIIIDANIIDRSKFRYSRLYNQKVNCDILLIGNSRGLPFYQPFIEKLTRKSTFNISYNGMPTNLALILFEDYLARNKKPGLVIIEATMRGRRKELVTNFGFYSKFSPELKELIYKESDWMGYFNDIVHLTRYNGEVFQRCIYYRSKSDTDWLNDRVISKRALEEIEQPEMAKFDKNAAEDYKKIIEICKKNNIAFKFVINPYLPSYFDKIKNFEEIKNQQSEYIGAPIYDFSTSLQAPELFADYVHVNKKGSKEMIDIFLKRGIFDF